MRSALQNPPERDSRTSPFDQESSTTVTRTFSPTPADVQRDWVIIDATDIVLGRLASHAAVLLRGKHKPTFVFHMDMGDFVIIINAEKVALTGAKLARSKWSNAQLPDAAAERADFREADLTGAVAGGLRGAGGGAAPSPKRCRWKHWSWMRW